MPTNPAADLTNLADCLFLGLVKASEVGMAAIVADAEAVLATMSAPQTKMESRVKAGIAAEAIAAFAAQQRLSYFYDIATNPLLAKFDAYLANRRVGVFAN